MCVATRDPGHSGDVEAFFVTLNNDGVFSFGFHEPILAWGFVSTCGPSRDVSPDDKDRYPSGRPARNAVVLIELAFYPTYIMDLSKYPLEKLFFFVAGIIPGMAALLVFEVAAPGSFNWFFALGFLGYRAKIAVVLVTAFVVGNSMTTLLYKLLGAIGGAIGGYLGYKSPHSYDVAPWRDPGWRTALKNYLEAEAPDDTWPMRKDLYDFRVQQINAQPQDQQPGFLAALNFEKLKTERDDADWARWYDQYHRAVLTPQDTDVLFHFQRGLNFNLETAAIYLLVSMMIVPRLRHWWTILPACFWTISLVLEELVAFKQITNKWSTLNTQITYLSELSRKRQP